MTMKVSATMSVKPPPSPRRVQRGVAPDTPPPIQPPVAAPVGRRAPARLKRLLDLLLSDFWIDALLMLFIVCSMLFLHR